MSLLNDTFILRCLLWKSKENKLEVSASGEIEILPVAVLNTIHYRDWWTERLILWGDHCGNAFHIWSRWFLRWNFHVWPTHGEPLKSSDLIGHWSEKGPKLLFHSVWRLNARMNARARPIRLLHAQRLHNFSMYSNCNALEYACNWFMRDCVQWKIATGSDAFMAPGMHWMLFVRQTSALPADNIPSEANLYTRRPWA